jgi:hypothetical protein
MAMNSTEVVQNLLAYTVVQDKGSLKSLLERNGVEMPSNCSDKEITIATLKASSKSPNFKNELVKLLSKNVKKAKTDFASFVGDSSDFGFTGIDDFQFTGGLTPTFTSNLSQASSTPKPTSSTKKQSRVSATNPQGKTQAGLFLQNLGRGLFSEDTINSGLDIGLTAINNKVAGRQNALQNEATVITQRQDEVRQTLSQPTKGSKTLTYVFVGVGILALIGVVYFVAKKKK